VRAIFTDTSGWVALKHRRDTLYPQAIALHKALLQANTGSVPTNCVLDETYTLLQTRAGHAIAVEFGREVRASQRIEIAWIDPKRHAEAWQLFERYADKNFSFTDCSSFVEMQQRGLTTAFTNDRHFGQMGFERLLRPPR